MREAPGATRIPRLANKSDWIARTHAAAFELIHRHRYREADFVVVTEEMSRQGISLSAASFYPSSWCERFSSFGSSWVRRVDAGVTLHWPDGTDYWGEAYDATDPICLLAEVRFWESLTDEDMRRLCAWEPEAANG